MQTVSGLDHLKENQSFDKLMGEKIAILCHSASIDSKLNHAIDLLIERYGKRVTKIFGPQHGLVTDVQDNMIETDHFKHPYYSLPVYSLYSETRSPTEKMLEDVDTVIIDLQDVGTRIYTYIYTMGLMMEKCGEKGINVVVLDRPNPIDGLTVEGNILDKKFASFVGLYSLPTRHGLTMGEVAKFIQKFEGIKCDVEVIPMKNWKREFIFSQTNLPWVLPSPNLPSAESCHTFVATVLFEGTNISEGRGTTKSLEIVGHPDISPHQFLDEIKSDFDKLSLEGIKLRPMYFFPMFQKHEKKSCGGFQIHVTDPHKARFWLLSQFLCQKFYQNLEGFEWKQPPYEYEYEKLPIDLINGTDSIRLWIERGGNISELKEIEEIGRKDYLTKKSEIEIYKN